MINLLMCSCGWSVETYSTLGVKALVRREIGTAVEHWRDGHKVTVARGFEKVVRRAAQLYAQEESVNRNAD